MQRLSIIILMLLAIGFSACEKKEEPEKKANNPSAMQSENLHKVVVEENMNASNYTYLKVKENDNEFWIAVPQMEVQKGETLYFGKSMEMKNFHSEALNRDFKSVLFVDHVSRTPGNTSMAPTSHPKLTNAKEDVSVKPLSDGKTIKQIYADKNDLAGKTVRVRGKVTKFNPNIMGRNWIHIQDGTESGKNYDLLVTSNDKAAVGQTIIVQGKVAVDKDFGAGYTYPVMIENAKVKTESK